MEKLSLHEPAESISLNGLSASGKGKHYWIVDAGDNIGDGRIAVYDVELTV